MIVAQLALGAHAQTAQVVSTGLSYGTLSEAIANAALGGDTLILSGTFTEQVYVDRDLALVGPATLVGLQNGFPALDTAIGVTLDLDGLALVAYPFDAITAYGPLSLANVVTDGRVYASSDAVTVAGSAFVGTDEDGALVVVGLTAAATVDVTDTLFQDTTTDFYGSAIWGRDIALACARCRFDRNTGRSVIELYDGSATVTDSVFSQTEGQGIETSGTTVDVVRTRFLTSGPDQSVIADQGTVRNCSTTEGITLTDGAVTNSVVGHGPVFAASIEDTVFFQNVTTGVPIWSWSDGSLGGLGDVAYRDPLVDADGVPMVESGLFDAGDPAILDLDGTRSDIGLTGGPDADPAYFADADGDGVPVVRDCDDLDPTAGAAVGYYVDADGDGYGVDGTATYSCTPLPGVTQGGDCDDAQATRNPGEVEICDDLDEDCVPGNEPLVIGFPDADGDGFGTGSGVVVCPNPEYALVGGDCDDARADVWPGAPELCDDVDQDCVPDDEPLLSFHTDADHDGYGDPSAARLACDPRGNEVLDGTDCDDADPGVNPGAAEICDGLDQDCTGVADDAQPLATWYPDADGDGYGDPSAGVASTCPDPSLVADGSDCDDADPTVNPAAVEVCDGVDQDCDGVADDAEPVTTWYRDSDGDGYGDAAAATATACPPAGWVRDGTDCDDADPGVNPAAVEVCDGVDQDCSGVADDGGPVGSWYPDADGDGYGDGSRAVATACPEAGWIGDGTDCDDADPGVNPAAVEVCDGVDQDCDGAPDPATCKSGPDGGCGCATGSSPGSALGLALVLAVGARRRHTARSQATASASSPNSRVGISGDAS